MGDPRFFSRSSPHALSAIALTARGTAPALNRMFSGVAPLQSATRDEVSFLDNRRYAPALDTTKAGAVIVHPDMRDRVPAGTIPIVTTAAYEGWARVAALFHPAEPARPGIHPSALVAEGARVDVSAEIGPFVVIEIGADIGPGFFIDHGTGVVIGGTAKIGKRVRLYQGVGLVARSLAKHVERDEQGHALGGKRHPTVGDDVTIYANATIVGGDVVIGDRSIIGGNVWLNRSIPPDSVALFEVQQLSIHPLKRNSGDWII